MQIRILPLNLCLDVPPTIRHAQVATSSKSRDIILEIVSGGTSVISLFDPSDEKARGRLDLYDLCLSTSCRKRGWKRLRLQSDEIRRVHSRFRAYWLAGTTGEPDTIVCYSIPPSADFMAHLPDDTQLGDITLPGTHESCAFYGFPISQCQQPSTPIEQQLNDGIRFLDVRLRVVGDELLMYHGPRPQRSSLTTLLHTLHAFLTAHPTETFLLSIKEEIPPFHPQFSLKVYQAFQPYLAKFWFVDERIPSLGEVRGKGMILSRFNRCGDGSVEQGGWGEGLGIHPYTWPDSRKEGFEWSCRDVTVRTQDWYRVKTFLQIPEKFQAIVSHLNPSLIPALPPSPQPFTLSYLSASYFPLSLPPIIAKGFGFPAWGLGIEGINSRFCRWILERLSKGEKFRACVVMDFYRQCGNDGELVDLLIMMNFIDR